MDVVIAQGMANEDGVAKTSIRVSRVATAMIVPVGFRVTGQCSVPSPCASRRNLQVVITVLLGYVCWCFFSTNVLASPHVLEEGAGVEVCEALLAANNRASPAAANENFGLTSPSWGFPNYDEPQGRLWDWIDYLWQNEVAHSAYFQDGNSEWRATPEQTQQAKDRFYWLESDDFLHAQTFVAWFDIDNDGVLDLMWRESSESERIIVVNRTYPCPTCNPSFTWDRERTMRMFQHPVPDDTVLRYGLVQFKGVNYFGVSWEVFRPSEGDIGVSVDHHKNIYQMQGDKVTRICSLRF